MELKKHLRRDRTKTMVGEFSPLGLLEVTRKRTRESLSQILSDTCPTCHGRGAVKTARTVCYEILRELLTEARNFNPTQFTVIAHPRVVAMLEEEESGHLSDLCAFVGKPVSFASRHEFVTRALRHRIALVVGGLRLGLTLRSL